MKTDQPNSSEKNFHGKTITKEHGMNESHRPLPARSGTPGRANLENSGKNYRPIPKSVGPAQDIPHDAIDRLTSRLLMNPIGGKSRRFPNAGKWLRNGAILAASVSVAAVGVGLFMKWRASREE